MDVIFQACTLRVAQCWSSEFLPSVRAFRGNLLPPQ